jgi:hypothetical protein
MWILALVVVAVIAIAGLMYLIGQGLGPPVKPGVKFDETPADVLVLDDGTRLSSAEWDINIPRKMTADEQTSASASLEALRAKMEADRRR